jgi:hypothetical protein
MEKKLKFDLDARMIVCIILCFVGILNIVFGIYILASVTANDDISLGLCYTLFGSLLLLVSVFFFFMERSRRRYIRRLAESGRYVWGTVDSIRQNKYIRINGSNSYHVLVRYRDPHGTVRYFRSWDMTKCPPESILGTQVPVYVDASNYRLYHVDLDRILNES